MKDMETADGSRTCAVHDLPDEVDAGAEATLRIEVTAEPPLDLIGHEVMIADAGGEAVATATLGPAEDTEGSRFMTGTVALTAPARPGSYRYVARLAEIAGEDDPRPAVETEFQLAVVAHRIAPVVWDVPQAVEPGRTFGIRVGASCTSECSAAGWTVCIRNDAGDTLAEARVGDAVWPGTEGLRYAEVSLTAPEEIGRVSWEAVVEAPDAALPHQAGRRRFGLRTAPPADARLLVEAVDAETGEPVPGLKVVAGPFSTRTGPDGAAELAVPRGEHCVFVSGGKYIPHRTECVIEDVETIRVALEPDTGLTYGMVWG